MSNHKFAPALSNLPLIYQGKTRDTFPCKSQDELFIVATGRLSTHNIIHLSRVPQKPEVLTALTVFWLIHVLEKHGIRHHLIAYGDEIYRHLPGKRSDYPLDLHHRAIVVKKLMVIPVEFILRGYLGGSLGKLYLKGLPNPYGNILEPGLQLMAPFSPPIFTPTDKSDTDDPLNGADVARSHPQACRISLQTFTLVRDHMRSLGLEFVDSKFELGLDDSGRVVLADEIATPDSSRFCRLSDIKLGVEPPWLDKQIARDEAERIWGDGPKVPLEFSPKIIQKLSDTYLDLFATIAGMELHDFQD